jgi:hypothetical protein
LPKLPELPKSPRLKINPLEEWTNSGAGETVLLRKTYHGDTEARRTRIIAKIARIAKIAEIENQPLKSGQTAAQGKLFS